MGRAIVREPAAFLMDEPLSNLDAKLRVQMRAEISRLQRDLGVTTIYVTHDQVEAMTMGDRVAVMRKGELQQVAEPQTLYDRPVNLFVGGFIGSPAMNMVEATVARQNGGLVASTSAAQTLGLGGVPADEQAALGAYEGRPVILGIRPGAPRGGLARARRRRPTGGCAGTVELREALGSELMVHFSVEGARAAETEEMQELASDIGAPDESVIQSPHALFVGRFGARAQVDEGEPVEVVGRHERPALLRPGDGSRDLRPDRRKEQHREQVVGLGGQPCSSSRSRSWRSARTGSGATKATQHAAAGSPGASRSTGSGPGPRRRPSAT